jgi:hypothetical protein
MNDNLTSYASYRISGISAVICRVIPIRDRILKFHTDSTQTDGRKHSLFVTPVNP